MRKALCTLLAVILVIGMLAGCGSAEETKTPAAEETKQETKAPVEEKKEEAKESVEEKQEETAEPEEWSEETWLPLSDSNEVLTLGVTQNAKIEDYNTNLLTLWVEEETGIDLQFVYFNGSGSEVQQQVSLMVAGGEKLPDILWCPQYTISFVNELGVDGYLVDMSDWLETEMTPYISQQFSALSDSTYERVYNYITDPVTDGIYALTHVSECMTWDLMQSISWINQNWLDTLGLEMPTNITELHDVLVTFRDGDPNGNGKKDEIPMIGPNGSGGANMLGYIINAYVYFDDDYHFNATDGQIWTPFTSNEYREALKTLHAWTNEGLIAQQCYTGLSGTDSKPIYTPEDEVAVAGVICGHSSVFMNAENAAFYEYVPLHYIQESETDKGGWLVVRPGTIGVFHTSITADCENPELAMKFIDWFHKDEVGASFRHGIQGQNWDWLDPNQKDRKVRNVKILDDGQAFFQGIYTWGSNGAAVYTNNNNLSGGPCATEWLQYERDCSIEYINDFPESRKPKEIVTDIVYTAEEKEIYNSMKQMFTDYILEARAKFGTGVWDPNNDADWNTYLTELETMGLSQYVENAQTAYTRMKTK